MLPFLLTRHLLARFFFTGRVLKALQFDGKRFSGGGAQAPGVVADQVKIAATEGHSVQGVADGMGQFVNQVEKGALVSREHDFSTPLTIRKPASSLIDSPAGDDYGWRVGPSGLFGFPNTCGEAAQFSNRSHFEQVRVAKASIFVSIQGAG